MGQEGRGGRRRRPAACPGHDGGMVGQDALRAQNPPALPGAYLLLCRWPSKLAWHAPPHRRRPLPPPVRPPQLVRRGGLRSTLLYNLVGGGEWEVLVMNALIGMGPGGVPVSMSLLEQQEPDPAAAAAAARAMGHGERGLQAAEAAAVAKQQQQEAVRLAAAQGQAAKQGQPAAAAAPSPPQPAQ